jgi:hypothetical protein
LLTAFKRFLARERDRAHAQKRGGGRRVLPRISRTASAATTWSRPITPRRKPSMSAAGRSRCSKRPWPGCGKNS